MSKSTLGKIRILTQKTRKEEKKGKKKEKKTHALPKVIALFLLKYGNRFRKHKLV